MGIETQVICHTSIKIYSEDFGKTLSFLEGETYNAMGFSENLIDVYDEQDNFYIKLTSNNFFKNFCTITLAKNELAFLEILTPKKEINLKNNINNLNILLKWQNKKQKQKQLSQT